jgi:hypothetical protein
MKRIIFEIYSFHQMIFKDRIKIILFFIPIFFFGNNSFSQIPNINISGGNNFDGEPFLAVNPTNPQNMVVAWMGVTITGGIRISIKTKASFDGGNTWGNYHVQQHGSSTFHSADVSMSFRSDGILYLSYIDYRQNPDSGGVYLSQSGDGGLTWTQVSEIWNITEDSVKKPIDRPWIVCDKSPSSNNGMLYVTTKPPSWVLTPNRPYLKTSADSGSTWSDDRFVDTTDFLVGSLIQAPMAALATSSDGALCIAYPSYLVSQSPFPQIYFAKSFNRGESFQYYELLNNPVFAGDTNLKSGYCLAANPADSSQLAFAYTGGQLGDADIFICTTNDGGLSWSNPVRVNNDAVGNGKDQDMVWATYNANGKLAVTWRDRRNGSGTGFYQSCETYFALSVDNGVHFQNNFSLSSAIAPFDSILAMDGNDFMSSNLLGDSVCAAWGDVRSGKLNIYFAKAYDSLATGLTLINSEDLPGINVFPNPATSSIHVILSSADSDATLSIIDQTGKNVFQKYNPLKNELIDSHNLANGEYIIVFQSGEYSIRKKFIIKR